MSTETGNKAVKKPKIRRWIVSREISLSSPDALLGYSFQNEGNIIMNPLFVLGSKWDSKVEEDGVTVLNRPGFAKYLISSPGSPNKKTVEIVGSARLWVPSEFEYNVFHAILAIDAINRKKGEESWVIEFIPADIINILGIADCGASYSRIDEAISRLVETTYNIEQAFQRKTDPNDAAEIDAMGVLDWLDQSIASHGGVVEVVSETQKDGKVATSTVVALRGVRIFRPVVSVMEKEDESGAVLSAKYRVEFDPIFAKNMAAGYRRYFDVAKHFRLKSVSLKRFYEIITWQSYKNEEYTFLYDELASRIPLNSGKMNKQYIVKYAQKLKEVWYIDSFDTERDRKKITIRFVKQEILSAEGRRTGEFAERASAPGVFTIEDGNVLKLNVRKLLNSRKVSKPNEEEIFELANDPKINVLRLDGDRICSNVEYYLRRRSKIDAPLGYLRMAIGKDYAKLAYEKSKTSAQSRKDAAESMGKAADVRTSALALKGEKKRIFDEFISSASESEISSLYDEFKVPNGSDSSKKTYLMSMMFASGRLKVEQSF